MLEEGGGDGGGSVACPEHLCRIVISINLQCSFVKITLLHAYFPENLPHIFRTPFTRKTVADCFWNLNMCTWTLWESWNSLSISNFLMSLSVPDNEFITSNSVSSTFHYFQSKALSWPTVLIIFFSKKISVFLRNICWVVQACLWRKMSRLTTASL